MSRSHTNTLLKAFKAQHLGLVIAPILANCVKWMKDRSAAKATLAGLRESMRPATTTTAVLCAIYAEPPLLRCSTDVRLQMARHMLTSLNSVKISSPMKEQISTQHQAAIKDLLPMCPPELDVELNTVYELKLQDSDIAKCRMKHLLKTCPAKGLAFAKTNSTIAPLAPARALSCIIKTRNTHLLDSYFNTAEQAELALDMIENRCSDLIETRNIFKPASKNMINFVKSLVKRKFEEIKERHLNADEFKSMLLVADIDMLKFIFIMRKNQAGDVTNWDDMAVLYGYRHSIYQEYIYKAIKHEKTALAWYRSEFGETSKFNRLCGGGVPDRNPRLPFNRATAKNVDTDFLTMPKNVSVRMVSSEKALQMCLSHLTQPGTQVGMDLEFRPRLFTFELATCALWQLATKDAVYIVDILNLPSSSLQIFASTLLTANDITIIGWGLDEDEKKLREITEDSHLNFTAVKDLFVLQQRLFKLRAQENVTGGLSGACNYWLGKPLDKRNQISNWEQRPLRPSQIKYAALDAHCLLSIYEFVNESMREALNETS
eukprot:CFRG2369T1